MGKANAARDVIALARIPKTMALPIFVLPSSALSYKYEPFVGRTWGTRIDRDGGQKGEMKSVGSP